MRTIRSDLVVISCRSICLGLACLHNLVNYTRNRNIYFIQVGKSEEQKGWFNYRLKLNHPNIENQFCPYEDCPDYSRIGAGNVGVHSQKEKRCVRSF